MGRRLRRTPLATNSPHTRGGRSTTATIWRAASYDSTAKLPARTRHAMRVVAAGRRAASAINPRCIGIMIAQDRLALIAAANAAEATAAAIALPRSAHMAAL